MKIHEISICTSDNNNLMMNDKCWCEWFRGFWSQHSYVRRLPFHFHFVASIGIVEAIFNHLHKLNSKKLRRKAQTWKKNWKNFTDTDLMSACLLIAIKYRQIKHNILRFSDAFQPHNIQFGVNFFFYKNTKCLICPTVVRTRKQHKKYNSIDVFVCRPNEKTWIDFLNKFVQTIDRSIVCRKAKRLERFDSRK